MTRIPLDNPLITNGSLKKIEVSPDKKKQKASTFLNQGQKNNFTIKVNSDM